MEVEVPGNRKVITDERFAPSQKDPRFQDAPRHKTKISGAELNKMTIHLKLLLDTTTEWTMKERNNARCRMMLQTPNQNRNRNRNPMEKMVILQRIQMKRVKLIWRRKPLVCSWRRMYLKLRKKLTGLQLLSWIGIKFRQLTCWFC
ncbi:unnamed protein product [Lactuca virosa]|uniref:Uncharacterized protein n=1 Tax=Lactuca virosa TaxID=75947 RepID=A0AAU9MC17_9ASTR|nr:unnamed protein product [Lactuca virosa]